MSGEPAEKRSIESAGHLTETEEIQADLASLGEDDSELVDEERLIEQRDDDDRTEAGTVFEKPDQRPR